MQYLFEEHVSLIQIQLYDIKSVKCATDEYNMSHLSSKTFQNLDMM